MMGKKRIKIMLINDMTIHQGLEKISICEPDIVLFESKMKGNTCVEAVLEIKRVDPGVSVLVLTDPQNEKKVKDAMAAGAKGCLIMDKNIDTLVGLMKLASSKIDDTLNLVLSAKSLIGLQQWEKRKSISQRSLLTEREKVILREIADGYANKAIAVNLNISEKTVKNHICNIYKKLAIGNRVDAAQEAIRMGLVEVNKNGGD